MRLNKLLFLPILILISLSSCKKESKVDQAAADKKILLDYIAKDSLVVDSTASGLYYSIIDSGSTVTPHLNSYLTIHYKGYYTSNAIFEQTSGEPVKGFLKQFIAGWQEGVPKIKKGGKIKLLIPSALAYGKNGAGSIPANTVLIFIVELINVE